MTRYKLGTARIDEQEQGQSTRYTVVAEALGERGIAGGEPVKIVTVMAYHSIDGLNMHQDARVSWEACGGVTIEIANEFARAVSRAKARAFESIETHICTVKGDQ